ncbi:MAG: peptide ABC transporter substrate-binding protein [Treponemataceae bacterium]|nr:MAG: peptide ABC transporter substrate-binding protein [Treponemataceae bacterium]
MKKSLFAFLFVLSASVSLVFCAPEPSAERPKRFDAGLQRNFTIIEYPHEYNLDPQTANYSNEAQLFTGLYEGLFSYDPYSLDPVPALASSYKISRDKKTWTFTIRENARFSNGDDITSYTIKNSWLKLLDPNVDAPFASLLDCVEGAEAYRTGKGSADDVGIEAQDKTTLAVRLLMPTEHLNRILCHHAFAVVHPSGIRDNVFSGPFALKEYGADRIVLEKNAFYHSAADVALPSITVIFSEDQEENAYLINMGDADWSVSANPDKLLDQRAIKVYSEFGTEYFFFKADRFPWNVAEFRSALLTAVPWDKLRAQAHVPAKTFIYSLHGYSSPSGLTEYDAAEARKMLTAAKKSAGIGENDTVNLTIAISNSEYMKAQAQILKAAWEEIGITVEVQTTPPSRYLESIESWKADLFTYTWIGDFADPVAFLELYRGDSTLNITEWKNAEFDDLLSRASACSNSTERFQLLSKAEEVLLNSGAVIPVSHPVSVNVIDTNMVGGWYVNTLDIHPYKYLYFTGRMRAIPNLARQ